MFKGRFRWVTCSLMEAVLEHREKLGLSIGVGLSETGGHVTELWRIELTLPVGGGGGGAAYLRGFDLPGKIVGVVRFGCKQIWIDSQRAGLLDDTVLWDRG